MAQFEIATFYIDNYFLGIDLSFVQEINKNLNITKVFHAHDYILGVMNLRGDVIPVIDLGRKLGLGSRKITKKSRNIILNYDSMKIGFLVDKIEDVILVAQDDVSAPPSTFNEKEKNYFKAVVLLKDKLLSMVDIAEVFAK